MPDASMNQNIANPPHRRENGTTSQSSWWRMTDTLGRPVHSMVSFGSSSGEKTSVGTGVIVVFLALEKVIDTWTRRHSSRQGSHRLKRQNGRGLIPPRHHSQPAGHELR